MKRVANFLAMPDDIGESPVRFWLALALVFIASQFVAVFVYVVAASTGLLSLENELTNTESLISGIIIKIAQLGLVLFVLGAVTKKNAFKTLQFKRIQNWQLKELFLTFGFYFFGLLFFIGPYINLVFPEFIVNQPQEIGLEKETIAGIELYLSFLLLVVLVPIIEEVLFRGVLFRAFTSYDTAWKAAAASSLLFGLVHLNLTVGIDTFFLGMLLCLVYAKTKNIWMPIGLHAIKNSVAFILLFT